MQVVNLLKVEIYIKTVLDHSAYVVKALWKIEIYFQLCTILVFGTMIGHVQIKNRPENQGCTPFTCGVLHKIYFKSF